MLCALLGELHAASQSAVKRLFVALAIMLGCTYFLGRTMDQVLKTLIVDDSLALCHALREHLLHYGVSVVDYGHDGADALAQLNGIHAHQYDALFIDLHMEGMDGLELMHQLHQQKYRGGVIIVSALDTRIVEYTLEVVSNFNLRVLGCIEKPIEPSLVAFMVRRIRSAKQTRPHFDAMPKRREVEQALRANQLVINYQPIIDSHNSRMHKLECLSRLDVNGRGTVAPDLFIPVIEKFGLQELFMEKLFAAAASGYRSIRRKTDLDCGLSFNLSPQQLYNNDLPSQLSDLVDSNGLEKDNICIEITENYAIAEDIQQKNLSRLRINGFTLSLDDYGAGFTNLRQITNMPFNEIKLDAELINGMHKDKVLKIIVETVKKVTDELDLSLVAEGIANPHDLIMLDEIGIHLYQGFFFSRPKSANDLAAWYLQWCGDMTRSEAEDEAFIAKHIKPL